MSKVTEFFRQVMEVFHQITWPKKQALIQLTIVVISLSIIISLILGGFDYLFTRSIALLGNFGPTQIQQPIEILPEVSPEASPSAFTLPEPTK